MFLDSSLQYLSQVESFGQRLESSWVFYGLDSSRVEPYTGKEWIETDSIRVSDSCPPWSHPDTSQPVVFHGAPLMTEKLQTFKMYQKLVLFYLEFSAMYFGHPILDLIVVI